MKHRNPTKQYVVCVKNKGFEVSLERRKIYRVIPIKSEKDLIKVVDESGRPYLYPAELFVAIKLPQNIKHALSLAA